MWTKKEKVSGSSDTEREKGECLCTLDVKIFGQSKKSAITIFEEGEEERRHRS